MNPGDQSVRADADGLHAVATSMVSAFVLPVCGGVVWAGAAKWPGGCGLVARAVEVDAARAGRAGDAFHRGTIRQQKSPAKRGLSLLANVCKQ
ncbi:MAG TPA: hypothetical protein VF271_02855 [Rhodanobacteraceae bacterium]